MGRALDRVSRVGPSRTRFRYLTRVGALPARHQRWMWGHQMSRDPDLYWLAGAAGINFDSRRWVGDIRSPVLVIITVDDQLMPVRAQYELAGLLDGPKVVELDARHEAPLTHAAEMAAAMDGFLRDRADLRLVAGESSPT